jgi:hypothetical protein
MDVLHCGDGWFYALLSGEILHFRYETNTFLRLLVKNMQL